MFFSQFGVFFNVFYKEIIALYLLKSEQTGVFLVGLGYLLPMGTLF